MVQAVPCGLGLIPTQFVKFLEKKYIQFGQRILGSTQVHKLNEMLCNE